MRNPPGETARSRWGADPGESGVRNGEDAALAELNEFDDWLLDDHLDQLSDADRARLRVMLQNDPELSARHRRLQRVLEPLDAWTVPPPSSGLVEKILDGIAAADRRATVVRDPDFAGGTPGCYAGRPRIALRDLIAVAAVLVFFFGILGPSMSLVRERSRRVMCAGNLSGVSRGVAAYALANHDWLPVYRGGPGAHRTSFLPVVGGAAGTTTAYVPNRRSLFLLVRLRLVPGPRVFICPSEGEAISLRDTGAEPPEPFEEWVERGRCSYASINMSGPTPRFSYRSELPYMADANPLFVGDRFNRVDPTVTNSPNHRKAAGQNVLFLGGLVRWCTTPNCGLKGDNIWQAGRLKVYRGTEVQVSANDTFLVP